MINGQTFINSCSYQIIKLIIHWVVFISTIGKDIISSYLNDFKEKSNDETVDEFSKIILSLFDENNNLDNQLRHLEQSNNDISFFIKDFRKNLSNNLNQNQKILEDYNHLIDENNRLSRINEKILEFNSHLENQINSINEDNTNYKKQINNLKNDISYYEKILQELTLVLNSIENDSISLNQTISTSRIQNSPYYRLIDSSGLFDRKYYNKQYLNDDSVDEVAHYLKRGAKLDYNPSSTFNTKWYRRIYLNDDYDINPFVEYLYYGKKRNNITGDVFMGCDDTSVNQSREYTLIKESGLFDEDFYRKKYNLDDGADPLEHYLTKGYIKNNTISDDFDVEWYNNTYYYINPNPVIDYIFNMDSHTTKKVEFNSEEVDVPINQSQLYMIIQEHELLDVSWYFNEYKSYNDDLIVEFLTCDKTRYLSLDHKIYMKNHEDASIYDYIYDELITDFENDDYDYSIIHNLHLMDSVEYNLISEDSTFDIKYYLEKNGDVKKSIVDPIFHYMAYGLEEGRNPSKDFNNNTYYKQHPSIKNKVNPLADYIYNGKIPSYHIDMNDMSIQDTQEYAILDNPEYFDMDYYSSQYDVKHDDMLEDYIKNSYSEGRTPKKGVGAYKSGDYVEHITNSGSSMKTTPAVSDKEYENNYNLLSNTIYFNKEFYTEHNPNISKNVDAIDYYLTKGYKENYPTSIYFDQESYLRLNSDIKKAGVIPLIHFINSGIKEQRPYKRVKLSRESFNGDMDLYEKYETIYESDLFDEAYYISNNPELLDSGEDSIIHYLKYGIDLNIDPSGIFSTQRYIQHHGDIRKTGFNPLYHYLSRGVNENRLMFLPNQYYINNIFEKYDFTTAYTILEKLKEKTTIILPISEDVNQFKITLQSILENTHIHYQLLLLKQYDDEQIKHELNTLSSIEDITIIDATDNYIDTLNDAIKNSQTDVVLLDENIILTPHWLVKLTSATYSDNKVAMTSTLTNKSNLLDQSNKQKLSQLYDINENNIAQLNSKSKQLEHKLNQKYVPRQVAENGCTYIKRKSLDDVDYATLSEDYITTLSKQLYQNNYICQTDTSTFTYTNKEDNPDEEVPFETNKYNSVITTNVNTIIEELNFDNKQYERILCFTQIKDNQPEIDDDIRRLSRKYQTYVLAVDDDRIYLFRYEKDHFALIDNIRTDYSYDTNFFYKVYINILINLKVDLLYTKTYKRLFHPTNRKFTSIIDFKQHFEVEELHEMKRYNQSFINQAENLLKTHTTYEEIINQKANQINFSDKKVVVYTAITGPYDEPVIPSYVNEDFDYICFTDNEELKSDFWDIHIMDESTLDDIRKVRSYKILPHKYLSEYDYSIWVDSNIEFTENIIDYIHKYSKNNQLLCIKHIERDCLYEEASTCISGGKDTSIDVINKQINKYKNEGYPAHNGLISSGVLFRNHNDKQVIKVMEDWFNELLNGSYRDQLSFNYACWKNNFQYDVADIFIIKNSYMQLHDHLSKAFVLRNVDVEYGREYDLKYLSETADTILNNINKTSILMQLDKVDDTAVKSIESVIKHTSLDYELILVAGEDIIDDLSSRYESKENIKIIENDGSIIDKLNAGINNSLNDVVLLDSDSVVTPKWLQKLIIKAYSQEMIATVSPITNDDLSDVNLTSDVNNTSMIIEQNAMDKTIITPLFNTKCVYIKKEAIYAAGFIETGYANKNFALKDYSLRLLKKGWHHVISPSVYVMVNRENTSSDNDVESDNKLIQSRYYEYNQSIKDFTQSIEFNQVKTRLKYALENKNVAKKRILYMLHDGMGGTLHTNVELMKNVNPLMDTYLLVTSTDKIELYRYNTQSTNSASADSEFKNKLQLLRTWKLNGKYTLLNLSNEKVKQVYFNVLVYLHIDIIHIRHMILGTFDMPRIAKKLEIPVILSFHDFYYVCPSHNLVDDNRHFCRGECPPLNENSALGGQCNIIGDLNIPPARTVVHKWRDDVREMFKNISAFVTTSFSAANIYTIFYPELKEKDFRIIEHGRDLKTPDSIENINPISPDEKIRIVFPGHIGYVKGYELMKQIKQFDTDDRLEYHYMGSIGGHTDLEDIGVNHGIYKRSEFTQTVQKIKPHFIGIFSICPETYCHTLTEGWASGIPILGVNLGAVGERIKRKGGGYRIPINPQKAYKRIIDISKNPEDYMEKARQITQMEFKTTKQMGDEYLELYDSYLNY